MCSSKHRKIKRNVKERIDTWNEGKENLADCKICLKGKFSRIQFTKNANKNKVNCDNWKFTQIYVVQWKNYLRQPCILLHS